MESNNLKVDEKEQEPEIENEKARLSEITVVEYNKKKVGKSKCYKMVMVSTISIIIFCILLYASHKTLEILYEDRTKTINNITLYKNSSNITYQINQTNIINNTNNNTEQKILELQNVKETDKGENKTAFQEKQNNQTEKKIGLAFVYSSLFSNGIARFITVTANHLIKTGKYDICFITKKPYNKEFKYNSTIKRFIAYDNYSLITNITKNENIDIFILQNILAPSIIKFYKKLGKKVIGMFHGVYMSAMFHGNIRSYRNWIDFDYFDSYVFIAADDYYFYKKLGFINEIYIPNLYTFEPEEIENSNLTYNNIMMLGRENDPIKGAKYAVKAMTYVIKEVPDARLTLVTSDSRIEFLRNLTKELNLTNNVFIKFHTYNISSYFWNSSVYWYTSLSEAFPMAMNEGKAHGVPVVAFDVPYSPPYQSGIITVDSLDCESLAKETILLLKDYEYRKRMGELAKKSLERFSNKETVELWGKLFNALISNDTNNYRKLQKEIEQKYYNEESARKHMEKHYDALLRYNNSFNCHTLHNFTDLNYIKKITECPINNTNVANNTKIANSTDIINIPKKPLI